jgi:hypothetical protein
VYCYVYVYVYAIVPFSPKRCCAIPGVEELYEELTSVGKYAIREYAIRESIREYARQ